MYRGDEDIRNFVFDLISPPGEEKVIITSAHEGLSNPAPSRGRRSRKGRSTGKDRDKDCLSTESTPPATPAFLREGWASEERFDCDIMLDSGFKKHLNRHANRVLLRIRMLFYLKQEILGDLAELITPEKNAE